MAAWAGSVLPTRMPLLAARGRGHQLARATLQTRARQLLAWAQRWWRQRLQPLLRQLLVGTGRSARKLLFTWDWQRSC